MCIQPCGCIAGAMVLYSGIPAGGFASRHRYAGQARRYRRYDAPVNEGPVRENDVLVEKAPSLNQYLDWRKRIDTHAVEIFEFNISDEQAEEIWTILRYGTKRSHPKGRFSTKAIGLTCGLSVAKFLHRFAEDIVEVDTVFFLITWRNNCIIEIRTR